MPCDIICQEDLSFQQSAAVAGDVAEPDALDDEHPASDVWMAHVDMDVDDRIQEASAHFSMLGLKFGIGETLSMTAIKLGTSVRTKFRHSIHPWDAVGSHSISKFFPQAAAPVIPVESRDYGSDVAHVTLGFETARAKLPRSYRWYDTRAICIFGTANECVCITLTVFLFALFGNCATGDLNGIKYHDCHPESDVRPDIGDTYQWRVTKFGDHDVQECLSLFIVSTKAGKACNVHVGQLSLDVAQVLIQFIKSGSTHIVTYCNYRSFNPHKSMEMELDIYGPPELTTQMNDACRSAGEFIGCGFVLADDDMCTLWVASQSYPFL